VNAKSLIFLAWLGMAASGSAQQSLDSAYRTTGSEVISAFEAQRQVLQKSSALIMDGRTELSYGVVISADGYLLTKASEIADAKALIVSVDLVTYRDVKVMTIDPEWDVALLKIEASGLSPVVYAPTSDVPQGTWVCANGASTRTNRRLLAGIVSARPREIPADGGAALGVIINGKAKTLEVAEINPKSGAKEAGLEKGDIILQIEGKPVKKVQDIAAALKDRKAGTMVTVVFLRNGDKKSASVRLAARGELFSDQLSRNDQMSGNFSPRRSGFPRIMQHDILGSRSVSGGPLLDLQGRCIGMNCARVNRAESFAIPCENLQEIATSLIAQQPR
jgi:serine protease Do